VVALGGKERWRDLRNRFTETFGPPTLIEGPPPSPVVLWLRRVIMPGRIQGSVIYFDRAGAAFERPLAFSVGWQSLVTNVVSPHGAVLRSTLEPILDAAGIPPRRSGRSQTVAVLLAFVGGIFGVHHFYLGHHRKGIWCCVFFWTAVPFVLGFIDAVRLALLDDAQFKLVLFSSRVHPTSATT